MSATFTELPPRAQALLEDEPFDTWREPDGACAAMFHRRPWGFLVRFPGQADFEIDVVKGEVRAICECEASRPEMCTLFHNSIVPVLGNYNGELNLHGSAVAIDGRAAAFMGVSRRGKTTLAGSFARFGHPFLSEDVLALESCDDGYEVKPSAPVLRLFEDSAAFLLNGATSGGERGAKQRLGASEQLPYCDCPARLSGIFMLGPGTVDEIVLRRLSQSAALAQLIQHAFILDVEDARRLRDHFERIAALAGKVAVYELDYPRQYDQLPAVVAAVVASLPQL